MIISASRRTDLPAFHAGWFINRLRAGYCLVVNPIDPGRISRVSLRPEDVDCLVFWTRDPRPLLPRLPELDRSGFRYYFQYTLLGNPRILDPLVPDPAAAVRTFRTLVERIGPDRVIWRYDPIVLSSQTGPEFHLRIFGEIASALRGFTRRVVVSFLDIYPAIAPRLRRLEKGGCKIVEPSPESLARLVPGLAGIAGENGMEVQSCAEKIDLRPWGIKPGKCVDDGLIRRVFGISVSGRKDPGQRKLCRCAVSRDIGVYGTCRFNCVYCYAARRPYPLTRAGSP